MKQCRTFYRKKNKKIISDQNTEKMFKMAKNDKIIWTILSVCGLSFVSCHLKSCAKCFRTFFKLTFAFSLIYVLLINLVYMIKHNYKEGFCYLLLPVYSVLMWYCTYCKRKEISKVLLQCYRYQKKYNVFISIRYSYVTPLTVIILLSPLITSFLIEVMMDFETIKVTYWTLEFQVHNVIWKRIIVFNGHLFTLILCFCFPFYLTFALSILIYRYSQVLSGYNTLIQIQLQTKANDITETLKAFFSITKLVEKLNQAITILSFLIISYSLQSIFIIFLTIWFNDTSKLNAEGIISLIYYFMGGIVMILCYTICCSMIPEKLLQIKKTVSEFINECAYGQFITKQNMFYLKRIENEKVVYISVCGLFHFTRSFILSALGGMLTYGLLITNF